MRPDDLNYTKEHEWVRSEGQEVTVGITDYAAEELGDIVFIELPEEGRSMSAGEPMGTIETVKAVEEVYAPVTGTILAVNHALIDSPDLVNSEPYGEGWLVRIAVESMEDAELMSASDYDAMVG